MVYLVSEQARLFQSDKYQYISVEDSLEIINSWKVIQFDTETSGRDPHICNILTAQFGSKGTQIVVDCTTIDIQNYKKVLEEKLIIGHNLKFDLQFLYKHNIIPLHIWDTMIIEQLLHLGYDVKHFHYSLQDVAQRYLNVYIDKTVRGEIIWRGLDTSVILYAAGDVIHLEDIKNKEEEACINNKCLLAAKIENAFVPVIAYLEWCGIKLDETKWLNKMRNDLNNLSKAEEALNSWLIKESKAIPYLSIFINPQMSLFSDQLETSINWSSSQQVIPLVRLLGFNTTSADKKTGKSKESIEEKVLRVQKGINDEFLDLYFKYQEYSKVCSTYGSNYLNAINPLTGRIHTNFKQLGAASGRMSCGNKQDNTDLMKLTGKKAGYPQLQNLPANEETRGSFVPEKGNLMCSCDYAALESRLGADIYNEQSMIEEYLHGSGDIHSLTAKHCFPKELEGVAIKDIKTIRPDLRKRAKPVEFSQQFGGSAKAIKNSLGCTIQEAKEIAKAYNEGFKGIAAFKEKGSRLVHSLGYVTICQLTGHKLYWEDWDKWCKVEKDFEQGLEKTYSDSERQEHNMASSKWDRMALNAPTQGTGIIIMKYAMIMFFKWILENNYFNKVLICNLVHDEAVIEFPKEIESIVVPKLKECMEKSASVFCKALPIPAVPEVGDHWIH